MSLEIDIEKQEKQLYLILRKTEENLVTAGSAFLSENLELANYVVSRHSQIEKLISAAEEEFTKIVALNQPVASDLSRLMTTYRIASEVERISILIAKIAKKTIKLGHQTADGEVPGAFQNQIALATKALHQCLEMVAAKRSLFPVLEAREESKKLKSVVKTELEALIALHPSHAKKFIRLLGVSRHLDRVVDHCSLIAGEFLEPAETLPRSANSEFASFS